MDKLDDQRVYSQAGLYCEAVLRYSMSLDPLVAVFDPTQAYTIDDGKGGKIHVNVGVVAFLSAFRV